MTTTQQHYCDNTFTYCLPTNTWQVATDIHLVCVKDATWMLTDYSIKDTEMYGDVEFDTIVIGSLGECLKYINKNIRDLRR